MTADFWTFLLDPFAYPLDLFAPVPKSSSSFLSYSPSKQIRQQLETLLHEERRQVRGFNSRILNLAFWSPPATTIGLAAAVMESVQNSISLAPPMWHVSQLQWQELPSEVTLTFWLKGDVKDPERNMYRHVITSNICFIIYHYTIIHFPNTRKKLHLA